MIVRTSKELDYAISKFTPELVLDLETNGLELWNEHRLCGVGICTSNNDGFYFPFRHVEIDLPRKRPKREDWPDSKILSKDQLPLKLLPKLFKAIWKAEVLIGHNLKFDLAGVYQEGFDGADIPRLEDTGCLGRLYFYEEYEKMSLDNIATKILQIPEAEIWKKEFKDYLKKNHITDRYDMGDIDIVGEYCINDVKMTKGIRDVLLKYVVKSEQQRINEQESTLLSVLWKMERDGMQYDREYLEKKIPLLEHRVEELQAQIWAITGVEFDIMSTQQLKPAFNGIGLHSHLKTETGREKWNLEVMLSLDHPVAKLVLKYREAYKMLNTYFKPYSTWKDGVLHPSFRSWGTGTGRMSCANPNLQNVTTKPIDVAGEKVDPKVEEIFKKMSKSSSVSSRWIGRITKFHETDTTVAVKRLFTSPKDFHMYMIDFTQMEMRVFSDYVNDPIILKQLEDGSLDFHNLVAKEIWGIEETDPNWKFYRSIAKAINFGMIYGIGVNKLSQQIDKTLEEAKEYKEQYFRKFPSALDFMNRVKRKIYKEGYITNKFGRRYYIPQDKAYIGVNYLVQGSSADLVKNRMIAIDRYLTDNNLKSRMVAQIHDEIVFYVHQDEETFVVNDLKDIMEQKLLRVFLSTEASKGFPSWSNKAKVCLLCYNPIFKDAETGVEVHKCSKKRILEI